MLRPNNQLIEDALGSSFAAWQQLEELLTGPDHNLVLEWNHYRDGGWLCKALMGKKNLAWLAVWEGYATITFYFAARHREDLLDLALPEEVLQTITNAETTFKGKLLPVVLELRQPADAAAVTPLAHFKATAK